MKAIALISGGLDSTLATRLIKDLGIEFDFFRPACIAGRFAGGAKSSARDKTRTRSANGRIY